MKNDRAWLTLIAVILAGLWGAAVGAANLRGDIWFLDRVEASMTDLRTLIRGTKPAPDNVTIIAIDDETVRQAGSYPLPRAKLAQMIDTISGLKPKVLAVDVLLVDRGPDEGDRALADTLHRRRTVLAGAAVFAGGEQQITADDANPITFIPRADSFLLPLPLFADTAAVGVVNVATDATGTPRFVPMVFRSSDQVQLSFPLRAAAMAKGVDPAVEPGVVILGDQRIRTDVGQTIPLIFYGPRGTVRTISASSVLNGTLDPAEIVDRVVVIGTTVTGGGDVFPTSFDPLLPGVEVVSTAIAHLLTGDGIVRDRATRLADVGVAALLPMILVGLLAWRRSAIGFVAIGLVLFAWLVLNIVAFRYGTWFAVAAPLVAAIPPAIVFGAMQLLYGRKRAGVLAAQSALLQQVQAPGLGRWLARNPAFLTEPIRQDAAIIFIDLSGFTGLSETLGPTATRELLNGFYEMVDRVVAACGGVIISFMGDGAMILFGLPEPSAYDAANAACCCVDLADGAREWRASMPVSTKSRIGFKIGAHFGTVVASRLGSGSRQQITATGDTVNVASRLMEVAARHKAEIAISDEMLQVVGSGRDFFAGGVLEGPLDSEIRGRSGSIAVWLWKRLQPA